MEELTSRLSDLLPKEDFKFHNRGMNLKWKCPIAMNRAFVMRHILGDPKIVDMTEGGIVQWRHIKSTFSDLIYERVTIEDKCKALHSIPAPHKDVMTISVCTRIKPSTRHKIVDLTSSSWYEGVNGILSSECHFPHASIITIALVLMLDREEISMEEALKMYDIWIKKGSDEWNMFLKEETVQFPILTAFEVYVHTIISK
jgi:hypothetical protein